MPLELGTLNDSSAYLDFIGSSDSSNIYDLSRSETANINRVAAGVSGTVDLPINGDKGQILDAAITPPKTPDTLAIANLGQNLGQNLPPGNDALAMAAFDTETNPLTPNPDSRIDPVTGLQADSGFFTVSQTGEVGIEFLFDGSAATGELAIFSLSGMEALEPGSAAFVQEAARRALSDSELGHIVISDAGEGAKFVGSLGKEPDWSSGEYQGLKTYKMKPGDVFAFMLVPNSSVQQVFENPVALPSPQERTSTAGIHPVFSLVINDLNSPLRGTQLADITGDGIGFALEEQPVDIGIDRDRNDLIFKVTGALGKAVRLGDVISEVQDWRQFELGKALIAYLTPEPSLALPLTAGFPIASPATIQPQLSIEVVVDTPLNSLSQNTAADTAAVSELAATPKTSNLEIEVLGGAATAEVAASVTPDNSIIVETPVSPPPLETTLENSVIRASSLTAASSQKEATVNPPPLESTWRGSSVPFDPQMLLNRESVKNLLENEPKVQPVPQQNLVTPVPTSPISPLESSPSATPEPPVDTRPPVDLKPSGEMLSPFEIQRPSELEAPQDSPPLVQPKPSLDSKPMVTPKPSETPQRSVDPANQIEPQPSLTPNPPIVPVEPVEPQPPQETNPGASEPSARRDQPFMQAVEASATHLAILLGKVWWTGLNQVQRLLTSRFWQAPGAQTPTVDLPVVESASESWLSNLGSVPLESEAAATVEFDS